MFLKLKFLNKRIILVLFLVISLQGIMFSMVSAFSLPDPTGEKTKEFNNMFFNKQQVYAVTVPMERIFMKQAISEATARGFAENQVQFDLARVYNSRIYAANLGLHADTFSVSTKSIPLEEVSEQIEEQEINGKKSKYMTVVFREKKIDSNAFNPFIEKKIISQPAVIKNFNYTDEHWEIEAEGYGYYEGTEDIDHKASIAGSMARAAVFDIVTQKALELGIITTDNEQEFRQNLAQKKRLGGIYDPTGCGVYFRKPIRVWITDDGEILDDLRS